MMGQFKIRAFLAVAVAALIVLAAHGQFLSSNKSDAVAFLSPAQATVPAGKPSLINLRFRVAQGLHINSHLPSGDYLIPTTLSIPDGAGARLDTAIYPNGSFISLPIDPKNKLSVYTGEFVIQARIVSTAGSHTIQAKLHYQACDQNQCLPPKTITIPIQVTGK
jgi:hypothetical protein